MAIQRATALPAPANEIAQARATLARRYGALAWDGPERRVLFIRVPRREPDPVNDVEESVEFLRPDDVQAITHCLLVGDEAVAQVYARPLQDLMRQREAADRATAAMWRARLPGKLAHVLFQSPDDPRRRWRLAVRLPVGSVAELDERLLEELAEGMGPELQTSRMQQVCAVYLIASHDDVRLEPDLFLQQMTQTWEDEDRRRRAALAAVQRRDAERRQREEERKRIVSEMERRLDRRTGRGSAAERPHRGSGLPEGQRGDGPHGDHARSAAVSSSEAAGRPRASGRERVEPLAEVTSIIRARSHPRGPWLPEPDGPEISIAAELLEQARDHEEGQEQATDRLDELRARVDRAVQLAPRPGRLRTPPLSRHVESRLGGVVRQDSGGRTGASADARRRAQKPGVAEEASSAGAPDVRPRPDGAPPGADQEASRPRAEALPSPRLAPTRRWLEAAGFEVIESPPTPHAVDLAGERPEGELQRIVVRVVDRLDPEVAKELLRTARELDVDLVLCVADAVLPEGKRLLVATKIKAVTPGDLRALRL